MSEFDEKFNRLIEEIKGMFVVAQAMAKNSFQVSLENERLKEENSTFKFLANANKLRNYHLCKALEVAETFLRVHTGTIRVLKQIQALKGDKCLIEKNAKSN